MNSEIRQCQNCKQNFVIEPEDFGFYERIKVPPPTWCPECRIIRRLLWRNDRFIYKRTSNLSEKLIFSAFNKEADVLVYDNDEWYSDKFDAIDYGNDIDFSKPFILQLHNLFKKVPLHARSVVNSVNSDYSNNFDNFKNCYLCFGGSHSEDSAYCNAISYSKDCFDCTFITKSELCYESFWLNNCSKVFFSTNCYDCYNVQFSSDLRNCSDCFGCWNLRNKQYYIFNQPYSKEEYFKKIQEFNLYSYNKILELREETRKMFLTGIYKYMNGIKNIDVLGEYIFNSKNTRYCYLIVEGENLKYCQFLRPGPDKDCYDVSYFSNNEMIYESTIVGLGSFNSKFNVEVYDNIINSEYCFYCRNINSCFGCIGLRKKQYCILNKQYTKSEYESLVPKIIEHMNKMPYVDKKGRVYKYGEFFPPELSPFAYNETIAQEYFPLTKEQALAQGYKWRDPDTRNYQITKKTEDLPDHIQDVPDSITNEIIQCAHKGECNEQCTTAFKIIEPELQFYRRMNLPLPRLCPNCRHYERLKQRNPLKLWHRKCQCAGTHSENGVYSNTTKHFHGNSSCPNEFETSYAPDRPEIVYCEECYNAEVV
jgi:hypothetical protein